MAWALETVSETVWLDGWSAEPQATRFQHPDWHRLFADTWPGIYRPCAYRLIGDDGTDCVLPGSVRRLARGWASEWIASPGHNYGGFLGHITPEAMAAFPALIRRHHSRIYWHGSPFNSDSPHAGHFTQVIRLDGTEDDLDRSMAGHKTAYFARRAERLGMRVESAPDGWKTYCDIYRNARDRWQVDSAAYPDEFIERLFGLQEGVNAWAVHHPDHAEPIAMGVFLTAKTHVVSWLTLARTNTLHVRPYQFLYVTLAKRYRSQGFRMLDLNPSGDHPGVVDFKNRLGAERLAVAKVDTSATWLRFIERMRA